MSNFEIRAAVESDIPAILELCREGFDFHWKFDKTLDLNWPDKPEASEHFRSCISDDGKLALVAIKGTQIVGYLAASLTEAYFYRKVDRMADLGSMIVTESERGNGIGKSLVMKFFDWGRDKLVTRVRVAATTANVRAIRFYKQCGFGDYSSILEGKLKSGENQP